ncbi:hypothetical protein HLV38_01650 [Berryella wangjianweii]|uniref:Uncharacterized protein n=1 Tax=Berryella wangjianweii TaxID=2734634 RepID=A0A6M8J1J9_9ACTN|nr:hypothetical protein [Berryella wangjianweii]QKF06971.1 hypothetical protein HLV38_01650 [Berryella wangjianweii]
MREMKGAARHQAMVVGTSALRFDESPERAPHSTIMLSFEQIASDREGDSPLRSVERASDRFEPLRQRLLRLSVVRRSEMLCSLLTESSAGVGVAVLSPSETLACAVGLVAVTVVTLLI